MSLRTRILLLKERRYKHNAEEGEEMLCNPNSELQISVWSHEIILNICIFLSSFHWGDLETKSNEAALNIMSTQIVMLEYHVPLKETRVFGGKGNSGLGQEMQKISLDYSVIINKLCHAKIGDRLWV